MKHSSKYSILLFALLFLSSCDYFRTHDIGGMMVHSSPKVDERAEQSLEWADAHPFSVTVKDSAYHVFVVTDSHVERPLMAQQMHSFVEAYHADEACPLAIHLGDMISGKQGFDLFTTALTTSDTKSDTLLYTVGNHDLLFGLWEDWRTFFRSSTYCFETTLNGQALDFWICLDTGSGTIGSKQISWLKEQLVSHPRENYRHVVVYTHTNFFDQNDVNPGVSSNLSMQETYLLTDLFAQYGVNLVLMGHAHKEEVHTIGGIEFYTLETMMNKVYTVLDMQTLKHEVRTIE